MATTHALTMMGFAPLERQTLEALFKMAVRRTHVYKVTDSISDATILLVNTDDEVALQALHAASLPGKRVLLIGKPGKQYDWPVVLRPIKLMAVLDRLDELMEGNSQPKQPALGKISLTGAGSPTPAENIVRPRLNAAPVAAAVAVNGTSVAHPVAKAGIQLTTPTIQPNAAAIARYANSVRMGTGVTPAPRSAASPATGFMGLGQDSVAPERVETSFDDILVVDDSDIALKFMQARLSRFGFRAELVRSGEDALARIAERPYRFVFMDVMMDGLDGYQTCRAIKQRKYVDGKPPIVVMLTGRGGSIDKIRGSLAGCDAYLTKPLNETELLKILSKYDTQVERGFRQTNVGTSSYQSRR